MTSGSGHRPRRVLLLLAAIVAANLGGSWLASQFNFQIWPWHSEMIDAFVLAMLIAYILAMTVPFVPGIEIGLALMLLLGREGIPLVFLCTQIALALSFVLGRCIPARVFIALCCRFGMDRACRLLQRVDSVQPARRLELLAPIASGRWGAILLRHRFIALAVALNLPGNALIGGAGGIGMLAGMSQMFPFRAYILVIAVATLPLPLFLLFGT
jgi:hypothetical protein